MLQHKQQQERKWRSLLMSKAADRSLSLRALAREQDVCARSLQERWQRFLHAEAAGDPSPIDTASSNHRGGHNRVFTPDQEAMLAAQAEAAVPAMTHTQLQGAALSLRRSILLEQGRHALPLRHLRNFHASNGFITELKRRNRLSSHRMRPRKRESPDQDVLAEEHAILQFVHDVRCAVDTYGPARVLNMDETPVPQCEHPATGIVRTGSGLAAPCTTSAGNRLNVTHFACISAAGDKLPLSAVLRGKTDRCLNKIRQGASAATRRVRLYYSHSGWINAAILIQWLKDVVRPWTGGLPAALVLDDYAAHWTPEVCMAASEMRLQLIKVPPGKTIEYQPLDVCFHGPMARARQRIWSERRHLLPDAADSFQAAVERAQLAYESMSKQATTNAWSRAWLVD